MVDSSALTGSSNRNSIVEDELPPVGETTLAMLAVVPDRVNFEASTYFIARLITSTSVLGIPCGISAPTKDAEA
jgi:hypothetical protein